MNKLLPLLLCAFVSCGSVPSEPTLEVLYFTSDFKTCSSIDCTTYMSAIIEVRNNLDYPVDIILSCDYYSNGVLHTTIISDVPLNEWEKTRVKHNIIFTNPIDDILFYGVLCKLSYQ